MTPLGMPASETCTVPVKPFCPSMETLTGELVAPCGTEIEVVDNVITKSPLAGAAGIEVAVCAAPPPHPYEQRTARNTTEGTARSAGGNGEIRKQTQNDA